MAEAAQLHQRPLPVDIEQQNSVADTAESQSARPCRSVSGGPGPAFSSDSPVADFSPRDASPSPVSPRQTVLDKTATPTISKPAGGLRRAFGSGTNLSSRTSERASGSHLVKDPADSDVALNGSTTPTAAGARKSVQFSRETEEIESTNLGQVTPPVGKGEPGEDKTKSLYSRLRALAIPQGFSHTRSVSASGLPLSGRSIDSGKDTDSRAISSPGRTDPGVLEATLEEEDSDADADAEESAVEAPSSSLAVPRKTRRRGRRYDNIETAPSSPHSFMRGAYASAPVTSDSPERPRILTRRATDTDMQNSNQGVSEDEGRKRMERATSSAWTPRHPFRGLSYGGQQKPADSSPEGSKDRRALTRLNFTNITPARENNPSEANTPKTPRRKALREGTSLSAARWKQLKAGLRMLGQRKKQERTPDHEKSAELLAELAAATPAALMIASMFQRDEHDNRRIPVLLEQLKVQITDSEVDKYREAGNPTPAGDRHLIFKIELEYGNGINRMKWVVRRALRDFTNLHVRYKAYYVGKKFTRAPETASKMPKFPRSAFPWLKDIPGLSLDDDEEEYANVGQDADPASGTDTERPTLRSQATRAFLAPTRRKSSIAEAQEIGAAPAAASRGDQRYVQRQRKVLEVYLQRMIKFMLFRPESNRLCKFLEVSALGVRLAAEGSYHGKEGYLTIRSAKGLDFRRALTPSNVAKRHTPKWFLVRHSYVVCVDSPEEMHIYDVFLFDSDFRIQSSKRQTNDRHRAKELAIAAAESAKHPQHHRLKLVNSERKLKLIARTERQLHQFEESIRALLATSPWVHMNRFDSFAPIRPNCFAQWLVDGRDYMWVVSRALNQAKDVIYLHDWWLSPELYMRRPPAISQKWRLDRLLKRKAEEGVKIFVIVYRNIESAIPIDSQYTKFSLLDLHPNIFVQRSPNQFRQNTFFWAHHEKLCIVDHTLAFVGGIDLCFGRWDTPQHSLIDDKPTGFESSDQPRDADHCQLWPGKDYSNPRIQDFYALNKPYEEMYDRTRVARMPWHDISMQVVGQPARDLTRHFVQRWNYILRQRKPTRPTPFLLPPPDFNPGDLEALGLDGTCEVQILRSAGPWSIGTPERTEHSIMNAYTKMIEESDHFVYIENQFFITSCETEGATVHNKIGDALVERIARASKNDESWRAVIILPLIPGFQNTVEQEGGTSVRLIMQYQYRSICRGDSSIFGRLRSLGIEPEDYIQFYSLRQWGRLGPQKTLVTEQLYIHAKCMIVDDRIALIGSANINERSMLGNRDSECAAIVRDTDMIWSKMNGKPYQVGRFPHSLRMRLMREHLGLDVDKIMEDAQALEQEHRKAEASAKSPEDEILNTPFSEDDDGLSPAEARKQEYREELLQRAEDLKSFNHDVDWEQHDNPNLKSNRKLTEDSRVTGNPNHRQDIEGHGPDRMLHREAEGFGVGRDTTIVKGAKEVLFSTLDPEGRTAIENPRKAGETLRLPSYVVKLETPNPPLPPKPPMTRQTTEQLGLPLLSQLPALPQEDDTDIGGPSLSQSSFVDSNHGRNPLMNELRRPLVDRDCMTDPIHDAFFYDTWHAVAENNTKIYRSVFRCMPDNEVRNWDDYREYIAYEQRFNQMQGNDMPKDEKISHPARSGQGCKSGPPGAGSQAPSAHIRALSKVPSDIERASADIREKVRDVLGEATDHEKHHSEKEALRNWAAKANQAQAERQGRPMVHRQETLTEERNGLATVHENPTIHEEGSEEDDATDPLHSTPSTATAVDKDKSNGTPPGTSAQFVGYSDALNHNGGQSAASISATGGSVKRRRRAATRSSRREFSASDDIIGLDEAEELLGCVQGHLILWPYDWLEKVEAGSNWLFPFDQLSPIEIYI